VSLYNSTSMQLITTEINPIFWVLLAVAIAGLAYWFVRRKKK
jgi:LPXTG-motif cell wall-anchored protein